MDLKVKAQIDVSVIFVNYNTLDLLCNAIDSVLAFTSLINYEIIVVDNSSKDHSFEAIQERYRNQIKILPLTENLGFGKANNEGLRIAQGRNIFFLNPDTLVLNNAVKILSDFLDNHNDTGIVGGNLYSKEMLPAYSFRHFIPSVFWELNDLLFSLPELVLYGKNMHFNHTTHPVKVSYITGADMMIPKRIIDLAGYFSPEFFLYFEETDLANRIHKLKFRTMNIPEAKIIHLEGESFSLENERFTHYQRGKLIFYHKNYSRFTYIILNFLIVLTFYSRIFIFKVLMDRTRVTKYKRQAKIYKTVMKEIKNNHISEECVGEAI